jgi:hypothetical protein
MPAKVGIQPVALVLACARAGPLYRTLSLRCPLGPKADIPDVIAMPAKCHSGHWRRYSIISSAPPSLNVEPGELTRANTNWAASRDAAGWQWDGLLFPLQTVVLNALRPRSIRRGYIEATPRNFQNLARRARLVFDQHFLSAC